MKTSIMKLKLSIVFIFSIALSGWSQDLDYQLEFNGIADNREYFSEFNTPQSILGSRVAFDFGSSIEKNHQFRIGIDYFYEFGSEFLELKPDPILYYQYQNNNWKFAIGAMPQKNTIQFSQAIIADDFLYYNNTVDGLLLSYQKSNFTANLLTDWVSRQDSTRREQFLAAVAIDYHPSNFMIDGLFYMFHNAHTLSRLPNEHIEDYAGGQFTLGYNFESILNENFKAASIKTGILNSFYRNRGENKEFAVANSWYSEIEFAYKIVGIKSTLNIGGEHHFMLGDSFYQLSDWYSRNDLYLNIFNIKQVKGKFIYSFHFANGDLDQQQQFFLTYNFKSK